MTEHLNIGFRLIKILDIGYTALIYFLLAIVFSVLLDKLFGDYDEKKEEKKSNFRKILDLVGIIWINCVIIYIARNTIPFIPSPFNNIYGFKHLKLKELNDAYVFDFVLLYNQTNLIKRMEQYYKIVKMSLFS